MEENPLYKRRKPWYNVNIVNEDGVPKDGRTLKAGKETIWRT